MLLSWLPTALQPTMWVGPDLEGWTTQKSSPTHAIKPSSRVMETSWQCPPEEKALQSLLSTTADAPYPSMGAQPPLGIKRFSARMSVQKHLS